MSNVATILVGVLGKDRLAVETGKTNSLGLPSARRLGAPPSPFLDASKNRGAMGPRPVPKRWMLGARETGEPSGAGVSKPLSILPGEARDHFLPRSGYRVIATTAVQVGSGTQKLAPRAASPWSFTWTFSRGKWEAKDVPRTKETT